MAIDTKQTRILNKLNLRPLLVKLIIYFSIVSALEILHEMYKYEDHASNPLENQTIPENRNYLNNQKSSSTSVFMLAKGYRMPSSTSASQPFDFRCERNSYQCSTLLHHHVNSKPSIQSLQRKLFISQHPSQAFETLGSPFVNFGTSTYPIASRLSNEGNFSHRLQARRSKQIILADECRNEILEGIKRVAKAVRVTLGPRGRNILLEREYGPPMIVNDGVTIARNIELKNRAHNAGAKLVQEVATTSDEWAGDGTSSTTILTAEIASKGVDFVNKGHNPIPIQRGIQKAARMMVDEVKRLAKPVKGYQDLLNIATVATSGNSQMGEVIAKAFDKLGKHAATILEDTPTLEDTLEFTEGYTFDRGYASPYFLIGEERDIIEWQNPSVMVCDYKIESAQSMLSILEHYVRTKEPLVIIAEDFGPEAMQTCIINRMRQLLKVVAIKAPSFGERRKDYLRDIAIATNAQLISKDLGLPLEDSTPSHLGSAQNVVVRKDRTSIITRHDFQESIQQRVSQLKDEMEKSTSKYDKEKLGERVAALSGGIARILIGASTETEQKEKRLRYEDSINAVRAAIETGYVPGGGVTYLALATDKFMEKILHDVDNTARNEMRGVDEDSGDMFQVVEEMESEIELQKLGARIVVDSMKSITRQIADNAGVNGEKVVQNIMSANKPFGFGWNAKSNKFGDMIKQGVIDPAKVIVSAIEHSTSVAGLVLTTEGMMVDEEKDADDKNEDMADM